MMKPLQRIGCLISLIIVCFGCGNSVPDQKVVKQDATAVDTSPTPSQQIDKQDATAVDTSPTPSQQIDIVKPATPTQMKAALPSDPPPTGKEDVLTLRIPAEMVFRRVSPARNANQGADFFLSETEVTNAMFAQYLQATNRQKGDEKTLQIVIEQKNRAVFSSVDAGYRIHDRTMLWNGNNPPQGKEEYPATLMDVHEGAAFCQWLTTKFPTHGTFRFPTVDEWMLAAYGAGRNYPWGNNWDANRVCFSDGKMKRTYGEPVRSRPDGRTPEGIYAMLGNVAEFVIHPKEVQNAHFIGVGARWMGGSFANEKFRPSQDYWGYAHSSNGKSDANGIRVLLDITDKEHKFKHRVPYDFEAPGQP